jgi:hypothetical protein
MIKAPVQKPIEMPKARPSSEALSSRSENARSASSVKSTTLKSESTSNKQTKAEENEFDQELQAKMATEAEASSEVKPVKVSAEQALELPSNLVQPLRDPSEIPTPKVFDPALTKGVEDLIKPKTTDAPAIELTDAQVLELAEANPEDLKAQALEQMPKTQKAEAHRSPAIEMTKSEIDPQLLSNEDFVAQKNLLNKKVASNPYGMKQLPQQQKVALETGLQQTQVVKEASASEGSAMNSQQFILGLQTEQKPSPQVSETPAPQKIFDMSNIKSSNSNDIMTTITDYVVQARAAKEPTVNMRVNHEDLGVIDITVSRANNIAQDAIAVNIGAHSADGKTFFQQNSKDLFSHLTTAGLNIADLKVETPTQTAKNDFDFGSQSGRNNQSGDKQFGSEQNQRRHESDRRQELWKLLNKEAA